VTSAAPARQLGGKRFDDFIQRQTDPDGRIKAGKRPVAETCRFAKEFFAACDDSSEPTSNRIEAAHDFFGGLRARIYPNRRKSGPFGAVI